MTQVTRIRIEVDNQGAIRAYQETGRVQDRVLDRGQQGAGKLATGMENAARRVIAMAGAYIGLRAAMRYVNTLMDDYLEKERDFIRLGAAIDIVSDSWERMERVIRASLTAMQHATRFSDNELARALQTLTLLTGNVYTAQDNLATAVNLASSGLWDLNTSARYVAMALEGNYMMLQRYIPAIRDLEGQLGATATEAEKTEFVMKVLNEKFDSMAQREMGAYANKIENIKNRISDLNAELGQPLAVAWFGFQKVVLEALEFWGDAFGLLDKEAREFSQEMQNLQLQVDYWKQADWTTPVEGLEKLIKDIQDELEYLVLYENIIGEKQHERRKELERELEAAKELLEFEQGRIDALEEATREREAALQRLREAGRELHQQQLAADKIAETWEQMIESQEMRILKEQELANLQEWTRRRMLSDEEKINESYREKIDFALEEGDILLSMHIENLRQQEIMNLKRKEELELVEELTQTQIFGARLAADVMYEAMGGAFDNIERMFINMIKRMISEALVLAAIMGLTGMGGEGLAGLGLGHGNFLMNLLGFGGGKQYGGDVRKNTAYMVGEGGPEMFVPRTDGYIVPNQTTNNIIDNSEVVSVLRSIRNAIYGTALTDIDIAKLNDSGNIKRYELA